MLTECGYNTSLITDMKKGKIPSVDKILRIAQYLDVSVEYLMGEEEAERDVIDVSGLSEESRQDLLKQLELLKLRDSMNKDTVKMYRAAKSASNAEPEVVDMPLSTIDKLKNAPKVLSDDDI